MPVGAVRDHDKGTTSRLSAVLQEGKQQSIVQGSSAEGNQSTQSSSQQRLVPSQRLKQSHTVVEVDQKGPISRRQGGLHEARGKGLQVSPDGQHAVRRVDCQAQGERSVGRDEQVLHLTLLAVLPNLEVLRLQIAGRIAVAVDDQYLQLDQLNVDLVVELGTYQELRILPFAAVGKARADPQKVVRADIDDPCSDTDRPSLCRKSEVINGGDEFFAPVELQPAPALPCAAPKRPL